MNNSPEPDDLDLNKILRELNNLPEPPTKGKSPSAALLTSSQAAAVAQLETLYKLKLLGSRGKFAMRTHALLIGPSGSGKTTTARLLTEKYALPMMSVSIGQWSVYNARSGRYTLDEILTFTRQNINGIILVDELDKLAAKFVADNAWTNAVAQEVFALIDGDERLASAGFSKLDRKRLSSGFLLVGAGAWQSVWNSAVKEPGDACRAYLKGIMKHSGLPEEVFYRFAEPLICVLPPDPKELARILRGVYEDLGLAVSQEQLLREAQAAYEDGRGMRHIENTYTRLCGARVADCDLRTLLEIKSPPKPRNRSLPTGESIADATQRLIREILKYSVALEEANHDLSMVLARSDPFNWLPLYKAIAVNTLELKATEDLCLSPRDLDLVPSSVQLESLATQPAGDTVQAIRQAVRLITRAVADQTRIGATDTRGSLALLHGYGAWVRSQILELLHRPNHGGLSVELAQVLGRYLHGFHCWGQSYEQALRLLEQLSGEE